MSTHVRLISTTLLALVVAAGLAWTGAAVLVPGSAAGPDELGGSERDLVHVATDKFIYRAGEPVRIRGVVLDAHDRTPGGQDGAWASCEIIGPRGERVAQIHGDVRDHTVAATWTVPDGASGGRYRAVVQTSQGDAPGERVFEVRAFRAPRFNAQTVFLRDGYGPGAEVRATCELTRAEGGVPAGATVTAVARVDGAEVHRQELTVGDDGLLACTFTLPEAIAEGDGVLAWIVDDHGVRETASKTIPILLAKLDVGCYPEGGELVAGLPGRLYVEARRKDGKPADFAGRILDADGGVHGEVATVHEGRGRIALTLPKAGEAGAYRLVIDEPAGLEPVPLPPVRAAGVSLRSAADRFAADRPLRFALAATDARAVRLVLRQREREVAALAADLVSGEAKEVELTPPGTAAGVLTATVEAEDGTPLAERLVFRAPRHALRVEIDAPEGPLTPGGEVELTVRTLDRDGEPVAGVVGLTVTDDAVREQWETRDHHPSLPAMALLGADVAELKDAGTYLADGADAAARVDLLLATQGWRRFAVYDHQAFLAAHGDAARRVLAQRVPPKPVGGGGVPRGAVLRAEAAAVPVDAVEEADAGAAPRPDPGAEIADQEPAAPEPAEEPALEEEMKPGQGMAADRAAFAGERLRRMPAVVRVYAHQRRDGWKPGVRRDFTDTLYWHAGLATDEHGEATVRFHLNDAASGFRILADAFDDRGALGAAETVIHSRPTLAIQPKLPVAAVAGDELVLPVALTNRGGEALPLESLTVAGALPVSGIDGAGDQLPVGGARALVRADTAGLAAGEHELRFAVAAGDHRDEVTLPLRILPRGFPIAEGSGGMLEPGAEVVAGLRIPDTVIPGSMRTEVVVHPSPVGQLEDALAGLIRQPGGCFEQTSSTSYPLLMAQHYFRSHQGIEPAKIAAAQKHLDDAYGRLTGFECDERGYEWFGADPGHEALTAYGLMQFTDMQPIMQVDEGMLSRTRDWLLARRDGEGGFGRKNQALDSFGRAPAPVTDSYIVWALSEAGVEDLDAERAALRARAADPEVDSYVAALAALVFADDELAATLRDRLAARQQEDGSVAGAATSITNSSGRSLAIETTALAVLAWLEEDAHAADAERGIRFLVDSCQGGRFGSTQGTVLALRAIVAHDAARAIPGKAGELRMLVDGEPVGEPFAFSADARGSIALDLPTERLVPGRRTVVVQMTGGKPMPCSIDVEYRATRPDTSEACALRIAAELGDDEIAEGEVTECEVSVRNLRDERVASPVAIVGLPGGCEPRHEQLKEMVAAGRIAAYEIRGAELICYWRTLNAGAEVTLPVELVAAVPGTYTAPASRAYLYYEDEHKHWIAPLALAIAP